MTAADAAAQDPKRPVVLCVLDGWGLSEEIEGNAVAQADTPVYDRLRAETPAATLRACGEDVGLPDGQMGNSEVGHTNLGAGRVVWMDLPKIDNALADGGLAENAALRGFLDALAGEGGALHLLGLMSDGGVHAHHRHIAALARIAAGRAVPVKLHLFLDGRDTAPQSAQVHLDAFEAALGAAAGVEIATVSGRFYAMDRDNRWERVARAWAAVAAGRGRAAPSARAAIDAAYAAGETDEFVAPTVIGGYAGPAPADGALMANFRADRAREILGALLDPDFDGFDRRVEGEAAARPPFRRGLGMVSYSDHLDALMPAIFPPETIIDPLGAWVSRCGKTQLRLAETEKYPHVTFFFNGGVETPSPGEERLMPQSPKVATYDQAPEMAAQEVETALTTAVQSGRYDLIVVNFANPDMVGHTGDLAAAMRAVARVDQAVGRAWDAVVAAGGAMLVTADHGNCETMIDPKTGGPHTAHTLNEVPIFLVNGPEGARLRPGGRLADVAPTLLELMALKAPAAMTGRSLLAR